MVHPNRSPTGNIHFSSFLFKHARKKQQNMKSEEPKSKIHGWRKREYLMSGNIVHGVVNFEHAPLPQLLFGRRKKNKRKM